MEATFKTYISYVIQKEEHHTHHGEIAELHLPKFNFYMDNTSQEVLEWADKKQNELRNGEKIVIINYFNVSDVK